MMKKLFAVCLLICAVALNMSAQFASAPAFPGAEGHGRYVTGGRGGEVRHVTNLNDSGTGSFREAVSGNTKKIVVFDVGGVIALESDLTIGANTTVLGQTAPSPGITLRYFTVRPSGNNIIRYIRIRRGQEKDVNEGADATWQRQVTGLILDHCSFSWSIDEVASFYDNNNFTMQWCTIGEALNDAGHGKGAHGYGGIWGGKLASFHHNMLIHLNNRVPRFNGARYNWGGYTDNQLYSQYNWENAVQSENVDFRNCVMYNWGSGNGCYGGPGGGQINIVNNYYKKGPATSNKTRVTQISKGESGNMGDDKTYINMTSRYYINGNYVTDAASPENFDWSGVTFDQKSYELNGEYYCPDPGNYYGSNVAHTMVNETSCVKIKMDAPAPQGYVSTHSATAAYNKVLDYAGASLYRDNVDERYAREIKNGNPEYIGSKSNKKGIIDVVSDVNGYTEANFGTGSRSSDFDTDNDGIPDAWEDAHGLDKNSAADALTYTLDERGYYTNLEVYANYLVQDITKAEREGATESFTEYYPLDDEPTGGDDTDDDTMESYSWSTTTTEVGGLHTLVGEGTVTTETDGTLKFSSSYNATSNYVSIKLSRAIATGDKIKIDYYVGKNSDNTKNAAPKIEYFLNGTSMGSQTMTPVYCLSTTSTTSNTETIDVIDDAVSCKEIRIGRAGGTALYITSISIITQQPTLYTVTFNANGHGTCETSNLKEETEGAGVILPTATPDGGYRFLGWATSSTATVAEYNANTTYKPSADMTLYAVWEKIITPEPVDGYVISSATGTLKNNVWTSSENDDLKFLASSLTYKSGVTPESFKCASGFSGTITVPSDFVVTSVEICGFSQSSSKSTVSVSGATSSSPTLQFDQQKAVVTYTIKTPKAGESLILTVANKEFTLESIALIGHPAVVLELSDDTDYETFAEGTYDKVVLKRAFTAGQWSTLVLPFDVTTAELVELFTNSSDAAYISRMTDQGLYYRTTDHVVANKPLLFMPAQVSEDGTYTFRNVTVKNATGAIVSEGNGAKMIGVYKSVEGTELDSNRHLFISGNKIYDASYLSTMKPFRAYIELDAVMQQSKVLNLMMDGGTTQLDGLKMWEDGAVMYNMQGQRVKADAKGLKIVGGKKVLR